MTVELVSSDMLAYECMECHVVYQHVPAGYQVPAGAYSSGYCLTCLPVVEARWFGGKA